MEIDHLKEKCDNPNCDCEVEAGHPYCSEHCRSAAEYADSSGDEPAAREACNCGHENCANT